MTATTQHPSTLGGRIRWARKRAKLSHDRLGEIVGTSRQHLIRLEKNVHKPRPDMLARIAEATGQPLSFFKDENDADEDDEEADPLRQAFDDLYSAVRAALPKERA